VIENDTSNLYPFYYTEACDVLPGQQTETGDIEQLCPVGTNLYTLAKSLCQFADTQTAVGITSDERLFNACILDMCTLLDMKNKTQLTFINDTIIGIIAKNNTGTPLCEVAVRCKSGINDCIVGCYNSSFFDVTSGFSSSNINIIGEPDNVVAIVLSVIGATVLVVLVSLGFIVYYRRHPKDKKKKEEIPMQTAKDYYVGGQRNFAVTSDSTASINSGTGSTSTTNLVTANSGNFNSGYTNTTIRPDAQFVTVNNNQL